MGVKGLRTERADGTRELILVAAERLFAEHGLAAVSNRQIGEAAGQGNNTVVGYHFGTKADLIRAIVGKHSVQIERLRQQALIHCAGSPQLRDWVTCLVRPLTDHLASLGRPSWYARFTAQVLTDPALREIVTDDALTAPALQAAVAGLDRCLIGLPPSIRAARTDMARLLLMHVCAEQERKLAEEADRPRPTWDSTATDLIDAIVGLLPGPVAS